MVFCPRQKGVVIQILIEPPNCQDASPLVRLSSVVESQQPLLMKVGERQ
jgi:hypothetical protein